MENNTIIYKYLSLKDALRVILNKTLKFSNPREFNDPFDCYKELLKFDVTDKFVTEQINKGILTLDDKEKRLSNTQLFLHLEKNVYNFKNHDVNTVFEEVLANIWISCFSETYKENLMWSHYGDQHKGVCIGFNFNGLVRTFDFIPSKVKYTLEFEKANYCGNAVEALDSLINTKFENWSYEKEIRLRTNKEKAPSLNSKGIIPIHPASISTIILGSQCQVNSKFIKAKLESLGYKNIELIELSMSKRSYNLVESVLD